MSTHTTCITSDYPMEVNLSKGGWSCVFVGAVVTSRLWAKLSTSAKSVLIAIVSRADNKEGLVAMGQSELMSRSGLGKTQMYKGRGELVDTGLLDVVGHANAKGGICIFQLLNPFDDSGSAHQCAQAESDDLPDRRTGAPGRTVPENRNPLYTGNSNYENSSRGSAAAEDDDLTEAFGYAGIARSAHDRLRRLPGITAAFVEQVSRELSARGKGVPVVIAEIEARLERQRVLELRRQQQADQAEAKHRDRQVAIESEATYRHRMVQEWEAILARSSDEDFNRWWVAFADQSPAALRHRYFELIDGKEMPRVDRANPRFQAFVRGLVGGERGVVGA